MATENDCEFDEMIHKYMYNYLYKNVDKDFHWSFFCSWDSEQYDYCEVSHKMSLKSFEYTQISYQPCEQFCNEHNGVCSH